MIRAKDLRAYRRGDFTPLFLIFLGPEGARRREGPGLVSIRLWRITARRARDIGQRYLYLKAIQEDRPRTLPCRWSNDFSGEAVAIDVTSGYYQAPLNRIRGIAACTQPPPSPAPPPSPTTPSSSFIANAHSGFLPHRSANLADVQVRAGGRYGENHVSSSLRSRFNIAQSVQGLDFLISGF